MLLIAGAPPT